MEQGFYTQSELEHLGLKSHGKEVKISRRCSIYGADRIEIGDYVRIDDFCVLSAGERGIFLGNHVHIAVYSLLIGHGRIVLKNFCGISSRVSIHSSTDDFFGNFLTNPTVPSTFTHITSADVILEEHVLIGSGSVILPGAYFQKGVAVGALSLVNTDCEEFSIWRGVPAKKVANRNRNLLKLEKLLLENG